MPLESSGFSLISTGIICCPAKIEAAATEKNPDELWVRGLKPRFEANVNAVGSVFAEQQVGLIEQVTVL